MRLFFRELYVHALDQVGVDTTKRLNKSCTMLFKSMTSFSPLLLSQCNFFVKSIDFLTALMLDFVKNTNTVFDVVNLLFLFIEHMIKRANKFAGVFWILSLEEGRFMQSFLGHNSSAADEINDIIFLHAFQLVSDLFLYKNVTLKQKINTLRWSCVNSNGILS